MSATKLLNDNIRFLDYWLDLDLGKIQTAINGDKYVEFDITTHSAAENRLERGLINTLNKAVDPNAYGIDTGSIHGKGTSTYTLIWDKSKRDLDLISGDHTTYRNDLAGISDTDVPFARHGFATNIFLDDHAYRIAAPTATVLGKSFADWTANWWIWALQAPFDDNPLLDTNGDFAGVENDGPVFFGAGAPFATFADRTFSVPIDTPFLIPVTNFVSISFNTDDPGYVEEQIAIWEAGVNVASLSATIDGDPVENVGSYLVKSGHFTPGTPEDESLLEALLEGTGVDPNDDLEPSASSGYWLMIEGLTPGKDHTISVSGTVAGVTTTIIDHIFIG